MAQQNIPQMTEAAYAKVWTAFHRSLPVKVTTDWVTANVSGYDAPRSAQSLIRYLRAFGLLNENNETTDLARQWRVPETCSAAAEAMLRRAFPSEVVEALHGQVPDVATLKKLFIKRGLGPGAASNGARIYVAVAQGVPQKQSIKAEGGSTERRPKKAATRGRSESPKIEEPKDKEVQESPPIGSFETLRYFLRNGRIAELRIPRDMDDMDRRRLFAHLKIDLLDHVEVTGS